MVSHISGYTLVDSGSNNQSLAQHKESKMYYEEKVIKGVLHFRTNPKGEWQQMSPEQLTEKVELLQQRLRNVDEALSEFLERM